MGSPGSLAAIWLYNILQCHDRNNYVVCCHESVCRCLVLVATVVCNLNTATYNDDVVHSHRTCMYRKEFL